MEKKLFQKALKAISDDTPIQDIKPMSGGCINRAYRVQTGQRTYFIKTNDHVPHDFFKKEADGLALIRATATIHVPEVYYYNEPMNGEPVILVMEWIEGERSEQTDAALGHGLAQLHLKRGYFFGLKYQNYIGELKQYNGLFRTWLDYFREQRLLQQIETAKALGRMPTERLHSLMKLLDRLDRYIPEVVRPSLLHGDLWSANVLAGPNGVPYLIDPAVLYGHDEFEMAYTELFGGFTQNFYDAYYDINPLAADYLDRRPLYQLFYLLAHLNISGETYGPKVDEIVSRYVG